MFQHLTFTFIFNLTPYVLMKINTTDPLLRYANRNVLPNSNYRHPYFSQFYPLSPRLGTSASGRPRTPCTRSYSFQFPILREERLLS